MKNFSEYDYLTDSIFVLNDKNKICYTNLAYKTNFNNAQKDIKKLAGYFDFDICILDNSNIFEIITKAENKNTAEFARKHKNLTTYMHTYFCQGYFWINSMRISGLCTNH